jgi:DNA-directed RNA polymerase specialized sigma24 family protein
MAADELKRRGRLMPLRQDDVAVADELDTRLALAGALRSLAPDHQLVVHLRLVEGLPFDDVARIMNRSVGACQMLMLRAARALRAALEAEGVRRA